jgi:hypothetical protein
VAPFFFGRPGSPFELIAVMTIIGVRRVAPAPVSVAPSTMITSSTTRPGGTRFARSSATAMQRTVCVTFAGTHKQLSLTYDATFRRVVVHAAAAGR